MKRLFSPSFIVKSQKPLFDKVLIANRGEIACRIMKTCKKLGIRTVAVYSEADRFSKHVELADEAYWIGPPEAKHSYLLGARIIQVAKQSGAQAIHPGYGFLSENAGFSELCAKEGVVFIGPPASAITSMGSKRESKLLMENAKVPCVPGYHGENQDEQVLYQHAVKMGFPLLIKAVSGGGGKGMKIVTNADQFLEQLASAKREAKNFFSDDRVLFERYLTKPRHIEYQIFADTLGNCVYLYERDCSTQRRHQKIIEEAPAPNFDEETRARMGKAACDAARAVGYVGAGTVEFIVEDKTFFFMEMNTRLQVEHPVTEMITGQDLVEWQLKVASGNRLPLLQNDLAIRGHSFEARIYSENPRNDFLPVTGQIKHLKPPKEVEGFVRVESGVRQGDEVSIYYDPMIAKLVVWGQDRDEALKRLINCLSDYQVVGLANNIEFLKTLAGHPVFRSGNGIDTNFIQKYKQDLFPTEVKDPLAYVLASTYLYVTQKNGITPGFRVNDTYKEVYELDKEKVLLDQKDLIQVTVQDNKYNVQVLSSNNEELVVFVDQTKYTASIVIVDNMISVFLNGNHYEIEQRVLQTQTIGAEGGNSLKSPMPGKIVLINVKEGDSVKKGQTLVIMEAMKMEHVIRAASDAKVKKINHQVGDMVQKNLTLVELE